MVDYKAKFGVRHGGPRTQGKVTYCETDMRLDSMSKVFNYFLVSSDINNERTLTYNYQHGLNIV